MLSAAAILLLSVLAGCGSANTSAAGASGNTTAVPSAQTSAAAMSGNTTAGTSAQTSAAATAEKASAAGSQGEKVSGASIENAVAEDFDGQNYTFSPMSLKMALSMLKEGASAEAASELSGCIAGTDCAKAQAAAAKGTDIQYANSFWVSSNIVVKKQYADKLSTLYGAELENIDFGNAAAADTINDWISKKTAGLIDNVLQSSDLSSDTSGVLVNTVHFKDSWNESFFSTDKQKFTNADATAAQVDMMHGKMDQYFEYGNMQGIVKNYANGCRFVAAKERDGSPVAGKDGDVEEMISQSASPIDYDEMTLDMPKFRIETSADNLMQELENCGVRAIFDPYGGALPDVSDKPLYVSKIMQKATVSVDENGTEAAAATAAIEMLSASAESTEIRVTLDSPFIYAILDSDGNILFEGSVCSF
jgi:serpin B